MATEVMTVADLANYLRLNEATVYKLAQDGKIPGTKFGRQWRFKKDVIDRLFRDSLDATPGIVQVAVPSA